MILREVHFPKLYSAAGLDQGMAKYHCDSIIGILRDVAESGIILVDSNDVLLSQVNSEIAKWSPLRKKQAQKLLIDIRRRNRLIRLEVSEPDDGCQTEACAYAAALARNGQPDVTICPDCCDCRERCYAEATCTVSEYQQHPFAERMRTMREVVVRPGQSKAQLEDDIGKPLFRYAKWVRVLDRYIGRTIEENRELKPGFRQGLEWLVDQYCKHSMRRSESGAFFEVVTGFRRVRSNTSVECRELMKVVQAIGEAYGCRIVLTVKNEGREELPHSRYLFTDQIAVRIDPGIDMFRNDGRTRKVIFTIVPQSTQGIEEAAVTRLPNITGGDRAFR